MKTENQTPAAVRALAELEKWAGIQDGHPAQRLRDRCRDALAGLTRLVNAAQAVVTGVEQGLISDKQDLLDDELRDALASVNGVGKGSP